MLPEERRLGHLPGGLPPRAPLQRRQRRPLELRAARPCGAGGRSLGRGDVRGGLRGELPERGLLQEPRRAVLQKGRVVRPVQGELHRGRLALRGRGRAHAAAAAGGGRGGRHGADADVGLRPVLRGGPGLQAVWVLPRHGRAVLREGRLLRPVPELLRPRAARGRRQRQLDLQGAGAEELRRLHEGLPLAVLLRSDPHKRLRSRARRRTGGEMGWHLRLRRAVLAHRRRHHHHRHHDEHPIPRGSGRHLRRQHRRQHEALRQRVGRGRQRRRLATPHLHVEGRPRRSRVAGPHPRALVAACGREDVRHQLPLGRHDLRRARGVLLPCDSRVVDARAVLPCTGELGRGQVHDALHGLPRRDPRARHPDLGGQLVLGLGLLEPRRRRFPSVQGRRRVVPVLEQGYAATAADRRAAEEVRAGGAWPALLWSVSLLARCRARQCDIRDAKVGMSTFVAQ
mmetsp:Transcript_114601/g.320250  ORF Transcript_114601/g.320250 Transcript_114601/m.320250 type:complete len:455 (-) Transcript_114601:273-1637(-)